jgi:hypothetical protein
MMEEYEAGPPAQQSMLVWFLSALGAKYSLLLPLAGVLALVLVLVLVVRGNSRWTGAALMLVVPLPLLVGLFGALEGAIDAFTVIAGSAVAPKPSEVAAGVSTSLVAPFVGMLLMVPAYLAGVIGTAVRSLTGHRDQ